MTTIKKYPVFEDNQVLTATQLNSLGAYLDEQTRISRTYLTGTGIVCGLEVTQNKPNNIKISKGTGVTSEGFLISLGECTVTHYRNYAFPVGVSYPHFIQSGTTLYPMYELLTTNLDSSGAALPGVSALSAFPDANWNNYVVILFLEIYNKDLYSCLGKSCDDIGIDRIFTVRKLLVSKATAALINNKNVIDDDGNPLAKPNKLEHIFLNQFDLDRLEMPRALLNAANTKTPGPILLQYMAAAALVYEQLIKNCREAYDVFELLLKRSIPSNPFDNGALQSRLGIYDKLFFDYLEGKLGMQYFYDFIYDLIIAYNEFCCAAAHLNNQCIPVEKAFPLHLMLGEITCPLSPLRQHFISAPIINEQKEWNEKVTILYKRIVAMLYSYGEDLEAITEKNGILVTPSKEKGTRLGARAIPVYYNPDAETPYDFILSSVWNEERCLPCRTSGNVLPGYHSQEDIDSQSIKSAAQTPLFFNINDHSFFRIEGHVGHKEKSVRQKLGRIAKEYNLDFDTLTLFIGKNGDISHVKCVFSDLETDYAIWRNKMRFFLTNIVKATKKMENVSGIKNAAKKEFYEAQKKKEKAKKENITEEKFSFKEDSNNTVSGQTIETENPTVKKGFRETNSYKGAYYGERVLKFEAEKDTGTATSDEEELSNRISQINTCLKGLIAAMPGDLEEFDFARWCDAYRCALDKWVGIMKYLASKLNTDLSAETRAQFMLALTIMHFVDRFFNFILIYPYLTIATISDTVKRRLEELKKVYTLSYALKTNPGLEHMAGVYRGQTFVLLAFAEPDGKGDGGKKDLFNGIKEEENELYPNILKKYFDLEGNGHYEKLAQEANGIVFGDLSGHVCGCDPCKDLDVDDYNVTPIAFPVTAIATPTKEVYKDVEIQLLNNVYNPDVFEPFAGQPHFGSVTFKETDYIPEDGKRNKILVYTVDVEAVKQTEKKIVVDTFSYAFIRKDTDVGETVSESTINIFIHTLSAEDIEEKPGTLKGKIQINSVGANFPAGGKDKIRFKVDNEITNDYTYNLESGIYSMSLESGVHNLEVTVEGFSPKTATVTITASQDTTQNFLFEGKI